MRPFPCSTMTLRTQGRVLSTYGPTRRFQLPPDAWSRMFDPSDGKMDLFDSSTEKISESTMMRSSSDGAFEACPRQRGGKSGKKCVTTASRRKRSSKLKMSPDFLDSSSSPPIALDRVQIQNGTFKKTKRRRLLLLSLESDSDLEPLKKCEVGKSGLKNSKKSMSPFAKNRKTKKRRKPGPAAKDSKEKRKITLNANMQIQGYELLADKTPDRDGDQDKLGKLSATSKWKSPTMKENIQGKRRKKSNGQHTSDIAHPKVYRDNLLPASVDADPLCHKSQDNMMDASSKDCPELGSQGEEDMILNAMQHSRYVTLTRRKVRVSKERLSVLVPMYPLEYEIKSWKKLVSSTPNGAACSVHQENLHLLSPLPFNSSMLTNNCEKRQIAGPLSHFVGVAQNSLSCRTGEEDTFLPKSNDTMDYSVVFSVSSPGVTSPNVCRTEHSQCASKSVAKASFSSRYLANHIGLKTKSSEADDVLAVYEHHFQPLSANKMLSNTHLAKYKNDPYLVKSSPFCKVDRDMKESPHFQSDPGFENVPDAKQLSTSCSVILEDVFHSKDLFESSLKRFGVPFKGNRSCISQNTNLQRTREDQTEENPHLSQIELSAECEVDPAVGVYKLCRCGNNISEDSLLHWCPCMGKSAKMKEACFWLNRPQVSLQRLPCAVLKELQMYGVVTCKSPFWLGRQSELHSWEFPEEPLRKKANVSGCRDQKVQEMLTYRSGQVGNGLDLDCRVSLMRSEITPQALGNCHLSGNGLDLDCRVSLMRSEITPQALGNCHLGGMAQEVGDLVDEELRCNLSDSNHETPNRRSKCSFMQDGTPQRVESCHQQSQLAMPKFTPRSWMIQKLLSFYHETTYHESPPSTPVQPKSSASRVFARPLPSSVSRVEFGSSICQQWSRFTSSLTACRQKTVIYTPPKGHKPIGEALSPCVGSSPKVYHALQTSGHVPSSRWSMAFNTSLPVERLDFGNLTVAKSRLDVSLSDTMNPKPPLALQELSTAERLFSECGQKSPIPFELVITDEVLKTCIKIGEGVYGEVYSSTNHNEETSALKIVPIEGLCTVNGEPQKTFEEILPEIIIAKELFLLSNGKLNSTEGFIKVKRIVCVQGCYPNSLLFLWDLFAAENSSYNNRPDFFTDSQLYIIFEFENGGCDLERFKLRSLEQGVSVLRQVTAALAVAEETLKFEHRDLHWGNVLIHETDEEETVYVLCGETHTIATHGIKTRLIDYTLSRLEKDGFTVFTNLGTDDTLFTGRGDYQFDIYRKMKAENRNEWSSFHPHSNVLWLHYLAHKLAKVGNQGSNQNRTLRSQFTVFLRKCLSFSSAADLLRASLFRD